MDFKNKILSNAWEHPYISIAVAMIATIIIIVIVANIMGYSPQSTVSSMISSRKQTNITDEELDELIYSINEKQKKNYGGRPQQAT